MLYYLECQSHNPPIVNYFASGMSLSDVRDHITNQGTWIAQAYSPRFSNDQQASVGFMKAHPNCELAIRDSDGELHKATTERYPDLYQEDEGTQ